MLVPCELLTVSRNTNVVNTLTVGAVKVAVEVPALVSVTVVPET